MAVKLSKKSSVSVNDVMSSEDENDSNSEVDQIDEEMDDINANNSADSDGSGDDDSDPSAANSGWADAINKVLSVKPKNKSLILSKAKKDRDIKRKNEEQTDNLEIVKSDGTVIQSSDKKNKKLKTDESVVKTKKNKNKLSKKEWEVMHKTKIKDYNNEKERQLCSIATKGVVQLFNAVKEQQKTIDTKIKEVGTSETRRDKMLSQFNKNQFLDKLKGMDKSKKDNKITNKETEEKGEQKWKVLRDDFMIGAKMKDWDKQSDSDEESND